VEWLVVIEGGVLGRGRGYLSEFWPFERSSDAKRISVLPQEAGRRYFTIVSEARMLTYYSSGGHAVAY
jgi:hypothetical protein